MRNFLGFAIGFAVSVAALSFLSPKEAVGQVVLQPAIPVPVDGTEPKKEAPKAPAGTHFSALKHVENADARRAINVARDCIKDGSWDDACTALQPILNDPKDSRVQMRERGPNGQEMLRWASARYEASNLLGSMPEEGLDVYEVRFGAKARALLDEAKNTGNRDQLAEVAQKFLHTKAGIEASDLLATEFLDKAQYFMAALQLEKLLAMSAERTKLTDLTLFKLALAYRRAGDQKNAQAAWRKLEPRLRESGGLTVGTQVVPVAKVSQFLDESQVGDPISPHDWPMRRGNITHNAQAKGSPPLLDVTLWPPRPTILDKDEFGQEMGNTANRHLLDAIAKTRDQKNVPIMSGSFPIAVGKLLIFRSYLDIRALRLFDEVEDGETFKAGTIKWKSTEFIGALSHILEDSKLRVTLENWIATYLQQFPAFSNILFENSLVGSLSTDHRFVYAIDDLTVPAPGTIFPYGWQQSNITPEAKNLVRQNALCAFNLSTGKFEWKLGEMKDADPNDTFTDSHFIGPPIAVGGKLYALNEKHNNDRANQQMAGDAELRLVCIDPNRVKDNKPAIVGEPQMLGMVQQTHRFTHDVSRRTNAVYLGYGEGILVCPTNAGEVLGVDLMSRTLAWSYPYREQQPTNANNNMNPNQPGFIRPGFQPNPQATMSLPNWKSAPPAIQDGKVVFTAPDAHSIHCINLRDGTAVWKVRQMPGDLYFAGVFNGKVLIVGQNGIRALKLTTGEPAWSPVVSGSMPSGQGVAAKNVYYLPLQSGAILAVDIEKGIVKANNRARNSSKAPGNLVFYEGAVLSQTPTEIVGYPQLVASLEDANRAVLTDASNAKNYVNRGELYLADGQVQLAVDDLHAALNKKPNTETEARARKVLYEALTDLMQSDFATASKTYLKEYREMANVPGNSLEEQMRLGRYYRIVGQGRESEGNLVEAYQNYRDFGELKINQESGVASPEDPLHKIPTSVWLRGRINAMMNAAKPEQRAPLDALIAKEWQALAIKQNPDDIRRFAERFDVPFAVGREARIVWADSMFKKQDPAVYLEAELLLRQVLDSDFREEANAGPRAMALLAGLEWKKNTPQSLALAGSYFQDLNRQYANVPVLDKKTGAQLFNEFAADPRNLAYLEERGVLWGKQKIAARDLPGLDDTHALDKCFIFHPDGDASPFLKSHRLVLDPTNAASPTVRLYDVSNNAIRWSQTLGQVQTNFTFFQYLYQQANQNAQYLPNAHFRFFKAKGNLAAFQVGTMVYCFDLGTSQIKWTFPLVKAMPNNPNVNVQQIAPNADGNLELVVWNNFNGQQGRIPIGYVAAVQSGYVALLNAEGMTVVDPLKGHTLWKKAEIQPKAKVFGDDQYIFVVEGADGGVVGTGRVLRAIDGAVVDAPDFGRAYSNKLRILDRRILAASPNKDGVELHLVDIVTGKNVWSKSFPVGTQVLQTEDPNITGAIEPNGRLTVLNAETGIKLMENTVLQYRVTQADINTLKDPLLFQDKDRFYVCLNRPVDAEKVLGGFINNNFKNGWRCRIVNGWVMAFYRGDGQHLEGTETKQHKNGDFAWHQGPIENQMVVLEQFDLLPVLLFSSRYNEILKGAGNRWVAKTVSIHKENGKLVYDDGPKTSFGQPQFYGFNLDLQAGAINMLGKTASVQHYINDGRQMGLPGTVSNTPIQGPTVNTGVNIRFGGRAIPVNPPPPPAP